MSGATSFILYVATTYSLITTAACSQHTQPLERPAPARRIDNLHAAANLYGVLRWFHPSDNGAASDWDAVAVSLVEASINARNADELHSALVRVVAPIAPTAQIELATAPFRDAAVTTSSTAELVAWQHRGFGDSTLKSVFVSKRRNRTTEIAATGAPFASLYQELDATALRGRRVRLQGKLRAEHHGRAQLWLRIENGQRTGFSDDMGRRPVVASSWQDATIEGVVDADAAKLLVGVQLRGSGTTWYDDLALSVQDSAGAWTAIPLPEGGFDTPAALSQWKPGVGNARLTNHDGWDVVRDLDAPASGLASLRIQAARVKLTEELFDDAPASGEAVDLALGAGLHARVPISLPSNDVSLGNPPSGARPPATAPSRAVSNAADVIVAWNALQHFWVYWDLVDIDWQRALDRGLDEALRATDIDHHADALRHMLAAIPDAHVRASCVGESQHYVLPFELDHVEGRVVVIRSDVADLIPGDVIIAVDHQPIEALFATEISRISGSPQWKRARTRWRVGEGAPNTLAHIELIRAGRRIAIDVARVETRTTPRAHRSIERLPDGVYYVDIERASMAELDAEMPALAKAPGIVFDLRVYTFANHQIVAHLLKTPVDNTSWLSRPRIIRPGHTANAIAGWDPIGFGMPALAPHLDGRIAFVIGPEAASSAESLLGFVQDYHLAALVGEPTAGTNGNMAELTLPSGCRIGFTSARVTHHDGSPFHNRGIQPLIPASRTLAGVTAGRDDVLERALTYVRDGR